MAFDFTTAGRIHFGPEALEHAHRLADRCGCPVLVVTGRDSGRAEPLFELLERAGCEWTLFAVEHEPAVEDVVLGKEIALKDACRWVVGIGGGSALDAGKAIAALMTNPGHPLEYLEVIGEGRPLDNDPAPYVAIPTTAGTGSEVTRNAVLKSKEQRVKVSLRSPKMLPTAALLDPTLTWSMPPEITASTGLDALTQLVEPFLSSKANPLTDSFCREGMMRAGRSLQAAYVNGDDREARRDMLLASLLGGLALANAGLGAVHGFAGPFGGMYEAPHGAVCAALLPHVMQANWEALHARSRGDETFQRFDEVARILTQDPQAAGEEAVRFLRKLCASLNVQGLATYGMTTEDLPELVEKATRSSSMRSNPIELTQQQMEDILLAAM